MQAPNKRKRKRDKATEKNQQTYSFMQAGGAGVGTAKDPPCHDCGKDMLDCDCGLEPLLNNVECACAGACTCDFFGRALTQQLVDRVLRKAALQQGIDPDEPEDEDEPESEPEEDESDPDYDTSNAADDEEDPDYESDPSKLELNSESVRQLRERAQGKEGGFAYVCSKEAHDFDEAEEKEGMRGRECDDDEEFTEAGECADKDCSICQQFIKDGVWGPGEAAQTVREMNAAKNDYLDPSKAKSGVARMLMQWGQKWEAIAKDENKRAKRRLAVKRENTAP